MTFKTLKQKLENPFLLVVQGFVAGTIVFWATAPGESVAQVTAPAVTAEAPQR